MSKSSANLATRSARPPVAANDFSSAHPLLQLTSMHGTFGLEAVCDWVKRDQARQDEGRPDSLEYLTQSMRFLMTVATRAHDFSQLCRGESASENASLQGLESTIPVLKGIGMDTTGLEKIGAVMRLRAGNLGVVADAHDGNADQVAQVINKLEPRLNAVLRCGCSSSSASLPN